MITRADLQLTKSDLVDPVKAGQSIKYQISVYNAGPSDALLVSVTDLVPTGVHNSVFSTDGGQTWNTWPTLYQNNDVPAGQTFKILIEGNTAPSLPNGEILINSAQTSSSTIDPDLFNNQDTAGTTIYREADLEVTKTHIDPTQLPRIVPVNPSRAIAGTLIYYQIIARNNGPSFSKNTVLTDIIPAGISNAQYSLDNGASWSTWTGSLSLNDFFGSSIILIRGKIDPAITGILTNTAVIGSDTPDPFLPNNSDTVITELYQLADLSVVKEELIIPLRENGPVSYLITVNNDGPSDASSVIVYDKIIPTLITSPEYSLNQGFTWSTWNDSINIGSLAEHHQFSFLLRGTLYNATPLPNVNPIPNTVSVRSRTTTDPNLANNQYRIETPLDEEADLSITKKGPVSVYAGEPLQYSLVIKNHSTIFTSANILVFDEIEDDDILNTKYSLNNGLTWIPWMDQIGIPSLAPQDSFQVLINGTVKSSLRGSIYNIANVLSLGTPDPNPANNFSSVTTQILVRADLRITKVQISPNLLPLDYDNIPTDISSLAVAPPVAIPGTTVYYALQYVNNGPSDAELILINDLIPANLTQVQFAPCQSSFRPWTGAFDVGTVEAGKGCIVLLKGLIQPAATGILTNTATIDAPDIPDPDPDNDTSTFTTTLTPQANLSILKQVNAASVKAGDTVTFTLQVKNHGPSTAQLTNATDVLPAGLHLIDATPSKGSWISPIWQIGTLAPNEIQSITIRAYTSLLPDNFVLTNSSTVSAITPDPDLSNNQSSATVTIQAHPSLILRKEIIGTNSYNQPGQTIQYAYHLTNTGDVDLTTPALIMDDVIGPVYPCGTWPLKHGETTTCYASYTINQNDINKGYVTNRAIASTYYLDVPVFSNTDEATAVAIQLPQIHIDKIPSSINGIPYPAKYKNAGDLISYRFLVTNTGNLTLHNIQVTDLKIPGSPQYLSGDIGNDQIMQPAETWVYTGSCQVNQQDVDFGSFTNIATSNALADLNGDGTGEGLVQDKDTSVVLNEFSPMVVVSKQRDKINNDPSITKYSLAGDKILYTLKMKNTGNITLFTPVMTDALADTPPLYTGGDSDMDGRLDVNEEWIYRSQCTVTQYMLDKGSFTNIAQGVARWDADMNGSWESMVSDTGTTYTAALQMPHITVKKTAVSINGNGHTVAYSRAGDIIGYILTLTNDGNITMFQPTMVDPLATTGPSYVSGDIADPGVLNPGETWTYSATHTILQNESSSSIFINVCTGSGDADLDGDGKGNDIFIASDQAVVARIAGETGGYVWHDLNGNGLQDGGEPPLQNIQVSLFKSNGEFFEATTTDAGGHYTFQSILPGNYYCKYSAPSGYMGTYAHKGNEEIDSDMDGSFGPWTSSLITNDAINELEYFDAGFFLCVPVGDLVWYDINKNDIWDSNENGINGLNVRIWRKEATSWLLWTQAKTGQKPGSPSDDGFFSFCVPPGEYYLDITMPPIGLVKVRANVGNNEEIDSDFPLSGNPLKSLPFIVRSGEVRMDFGAGFYPMSSVGNTVWLDKNINGMQDQGEPKIAGVRVEAVESISGNKVAEAITNTEGIYTLDYMEKSSYYLRFSPPVGYSATYARRGEDDIDSDVDHSFGTNTTRAISLLPGQIRENIDMGLVQSPLALQWLSISGQVKDSKHIISWSTSKEISTDYYQIERKTTDQTETEVMPDTIRAKGLSSNIANYSCIFDNIAVNTEFIYRVRETAFDGSHSWSSWISLESKEPQESRVFPNPSTGMSQLLLSLSNETEVEISVWKEQSKLACIKPVSLTDKGNYAYPIDLQGFPNGLYTIEVKVGDTINTHLLLKIE
ncbi:MAG: hypothetical protein LW630_11200 [Saprospiraceae bacterium]|nr:hypothetical protein [Saprospiraceae bacterium]